MALIHTKFDHQMPLQNLETLLFKKYDLFRLSVDEDLANHAARCYRSMSEHRQLAYKLHYDLLL